MAEFAGNWSSWTQQLTSRPSALGARLTDTRQFHLWKIRLMSFSKSMHGEIHWLRRCRVYSLTSWFRVLLRRTQTTAYTTPCRKLSTKSTSVKGSASSGRHRSVRSNVHVGVAVYEAYTAEVNATDRSRYHRRKDQDSVCVKRPISSRHHP